MIEFIRMKSKSCYTMCMKKKLTLSLPEELIDFIHQYSEKTGTSVSALVGQYFQSLQGQDIPDDQSKVVQELLGAMTEGGR
jgi:hypothetical protein